MARLLDNMLSAAGFLVKTTKRGSSSPESLDDYVLLVLDGDPTRQLDSIAPAVVVISPRDAVASYDKGADMVVNKPLVANIFMARVRSVLRRYGIDL